MGKGIVVVGSCMIDFVSYAPKLPVEGETVHGTKFVTGFGGKGANQCAAAAKLGGQTSLVARLGDDSWGRDYIKLLKDLQVDTTHVKLTPNCSSGIAQIVVDDAGRNQIVIVGGANQKLSIEDVSNAKQTISNAAVLVCQLETPTEVAISALEMCKGISILNGAPAISNCDPRLLTLPTIFCVNESEATVFTGHCVKCISDAKTAIIALLRLGCNTVILTLGDEGALVASKKQPNPVHVKTPKVVAVDSTGAGDAFIGAFAYLRAEYEQFDLIKCTEIACVMAANSVTKPGTQISFPDATYLHQYLQQKHLL